MGAGRKRKAAPWDKSKGWKSVKVGDDLMLGSTESGFMGLEVLEPEETLLFGNHKRQAEPSSEPGDDEGAELEAILEANEEPAAASAPKRKKAKVAVPSSAKVQDHTPARSTASAPSGNKLALLTAKIAALEAENSALKSQRTFEAAKPGKRKKKDSKATKSSAATASKPTEPTNVAETVDISAWSDFDLHPKIAQAIAQAGFTQPTPIQEHCLLPAIRDRRDVIGAAQTGSGKTLAFGLPILQRLMLNKEGLAADVPTKLRALILAPTRELALQVCEHLQRVGKVCGVWAVPIVGGISPIKQERLLKKLPEIVVATPGRLWELMQEGHAHLTDMSGLNFFVLDEADRMVQQGHFQEMEHILEHIKGSRAVDNSQPDEFDHRQKLTAEGPGNDDIDGDEDDDDENDGAAADEPVGVPEGHRSAKPGRQKRLQTMVFSATLTLPQHLRKRLKKGGGGSSGSATLDRLMEQIPFGPKPKIVDLTSDRKLADKVEEACLECSDAQRDEFLYYILAQHPGRTLVFVNAISAVRRVAALLKLLGLPAVALHASMQQRQRLKALDRFKADPTGVLVATDVAARGLDITDVRCVIHYQLPASADVYVHRSGRTGRGSQDGITIALVTPKEAARYQGLQKAMDRPVPSDFPVDSTLMPAVHKRVRLAIRLDEVQRVQTKEKAEQSWRQRAADEVGIELSEDEGDLDPFEDDLAIRGKGGRKTGGRQTGTADAAVAAKQLQKELAEALADPLVPKFSHRFFTGGAAAAVGAQQAAVPTSVAANSETEGPNQAPVVQQAVDYANKVQEHRKAAAAQQATKKSRTKGQPTAVAPLRKPVKISRQMAEDQALEAALNRGRVKKDMRQRNTKLMVIPAAFGREQRGADALQALQAKMGVRPTAAK